VNSIVTVPDGRCRSPDPIAPTTLPDDHHQIPPLSIADGEHTRKGIMLVATCGTNDADDLNAWPRGPALALALDPGAAALVESRFDPTSGLLTANAYALPFANSAHLLLAQRRHPAANGRSDRRVR
jgi:hypothetical protein